jgi:deferrochelatase/peroxidase EfeB
LADAQLAVQSWQFVLQQVDKTIEINRDCNYTIDDNEKTLLVNGSFAAFRVLEQNVVAFEKYLEDNTDKIPSETLAAKMCGRWRDGSPLELDPFHDQPVAPEDINNFNYKNDVKGYRCPISSHIRRTNPRDQRIQGGNDGEGKSVRNNRIMRRAMPYGPEYTPGAGDDGINRGLVGMFICANLATQFEFIMSHWVHDGQFAGSKPKGKDPLLGNNDPSDSIFNIPIENATSLNLEGFPQFIATRGSAYLFLPSLTGLKYIADAPAV